MPPAVRPGWLLDPFYNHIPIMVSFTVIWVLTERSTQIAPPTLRKPIPSFVNKGLDKERNRRLRSNEGTMNKRQILACKKALRREGTLKYDAVAAAAAAAVAEAEAMSATESEEANGEPNDSFEQEHAQVWHP